VVAQVLAKGKGKFRGCGLKLTLEGHGITWHVDHDIPLSRQGSHDLKNLWPLCTPCNHDKKDSTFHEFKAGKTYKRGEDVL
jgi:5-methylcytosine-specific restriction endonuclease McrA